MKSMQMVDNPFQRGDWSDNYNPTIRRMMIADIYTHAGVSDYRKNPDTGSSEFIEDTNPDHFWMLSKITQSPYFDRLQKGKNMTKEHRKVLVIARRANLVAIEMENASTAEEAARLTIKLKEGKITDQEKAQLYSLPAQLREKAFKLSPGELWRDISKIKTARDKYADFLARTEQAIQDPFSEDTKAFFQDIDENKKYNFQVANKKEWWNVLEPTDFRNMESDMHEIEYNYRTFELEDASIMDIFDRMGMNLVGVYAAYQKAVEEKPYLSVANWDNLFQPDKTEEFDELITLFENILPPSDQGGKRDFIESLKTLRGRGAAMLSLEESPSSRDNQPATIAIYKMLKKHIEMGQNIQTDEKISTDEVDKKLKGKHIGDDFTDYAKQIWKMAAGPGKSWAERAAGIVIIMGFLKMARKAWKGDDKYGKLFRGLFIAGAAEIALKEITGRGGRVQEPRFRDHRAGARLLRLPHQPYSSRIFRRLHR